MTNEPVVVGRHYEFLRWLMQRVAKYPRSYRFTLGDRTINLGLEILERLLEATYTKSKIEPLSSANLVLDKLRFMVRLAKDERCLGLSQYEFASREMTEIGRQIGGWLKQAGGR